MHQDRQQSIRELFDEYIQLYAMRDDRLTSRFSQCFSGFTGSWGRLISDHDEWGRITRQDFAQVPGPIRLEPLEVTVQDLCDEVVSVAATLHIHLPDPSDFPASQEVRLMLVFRREGTDWMITHCSYSVPYQNTQDGEVYPLQQLRKQNDALQAQIAERTRELDQSRGFYRMLAEDADDVHWRIDHNFIITYISPADQRLRGFPADEVIGHPLFDLLTEDAANRAREVLNAFLQDDPGTAPSVFRKFEMPQPCQDGNLIWGEVMVKADRDDQGSIVGFHGITRNVTERKRLEDQVRQLAFHDTLTRLANRRLLLEHLDQAMAASKRSHQHGALLYLDLDNFKPLNDSHGHGMGDLLLIEVAHRLKDSVREADTVARIGGDEFVLLLPGLDKLRGQAVKQAISVADKIRAKLAEPYALRAAADAPAITHNCTASIGIALFRGHEEKADKLIERADQAMYRAKEAGRNRVELAAEKTLT